MGVFLRLLWFPRSILSDPLNSCSSRNFESMGSTLIRNFALPGSSIFLMLAIVATSQKPLWSFMDRELISRVYNPLRFRCAIHGSTSTFPRSTTGTVAIKFDAIFFEGKGCPTSSKYSLNFAAPAVRFGIFVIRSLINGRMSCLMRPPHRIVVHSRCT
ncbi:hypothetical protein EGW08_000657 [Elysia chlorotica]|uniref:Secreted protein n=1 Tax=Elysia chlorotica TaxID=188477 RepID=A0A3S1I3H7_ELYCH|nr:hypothetical protein EGW08_000657 [Elysia chlorotica]